MRLSAITLFPEMFDALKNEGVVSRGTAKSLLQIDTVNLREFADNARGFVDDTPTGGGDGMVIRPDIATKALQSIKTPQSLVVLTTPRGKIFTNTHAKELAQKSHVIFLCGRYAGFDERFVTKYVDLHLSVGDFVLSGGELAAMCMMDSLARFVPGVLGNGESAQHDSFEDGLLEAPCYTKPTVFENENVPPVLLAGDHKKIQDYRRSEQLKITARMRPDLIHLLWDTLTRAEKTLVEKIWKHVR